VGGGDEGGEHKHMKLIPSSQKFEFVNAVVRIVCIHERDGESWTHSVRKWR
jgi:hypothetical protein